MRKFRVPALSVGLLKTVLCIEMNCVVVKSCEVRTVYLMAWRGEDESRIRTRLEVMDQPGRRHILGERGGTGFKEHQRLTHVLPVAHLKVVAEDW